MNPVSGCYRRLTITLVVVAALSSLATAQSKDSTAPPPVVFSGFVDSYFSFNFARPTTHVNSMRVFDGTENSFAISEAELSISKAAAPIGFRVDLDFGPTNDLAQSGAPGSVANVGQAYITYVAPVGEGLTIDAGKFVTHMGFEVIKAKDDYNYSRSISFGYAIPFYHLGVRASYPLSSKLTLTGYMYNSFNGLTVNSGKSFGLEATYTPSSAVTVIGNWIGGPANPDTTSKKFRNIGNLIVSVAPSEKLTLVGEMVYGQENLPGLTALWRAYAGYLKYSLCDPSSLTLRGELYDDPEGFTLGLPGTPVKWKEVTLTYEYKGLSNLILRTEYRYDWSDVSLFAGDGALRNNISTLTVGAIVVF
jgi:hypothetical protein